MALVSFHCCLWVIGEYVPGSVKEKKNDILIHILIDVQDIGNLTLSSPIVYKNWLIKSEKISNHHTTGPSTLPNDVIWNYVKFFSFDFLIFWTPGSPKTPQNFEIMKVQKNRFPKSPMVHGCERSEYWIRNGNLGWKGLTSLYLIFELHHSRPYTFFM